MSTIDLTKLPPPDIIETLNYEVILSELITEYQTRYPEFTAVLESEPVIKILEVFAYRELLLRARINDAAHAVMLAYAKGNDLDHLAANVGVYRYCLEEGSPNAIPPIPPLFESDEALRARTQLAPEGWSTAGSIGAYIFHAKNADKDVKDVSVTSPVAGEVHVHILSQQGDGTASSELLNTVLQALNADDIRPLTDEVQVFSAVIKPFKVAATLTLQQGATPDTILKQAEQELLKYLKKQHRLQGWITRSGILAALHVEGLECVVLKRGVHDLKCESFEAPYCIDYDLALQ